MFSTDTDSSEFANSAYIQILSSSEVLIGLLKNYYTQLNSDDYEKYVRQVSSYQLRRFSKSTRFLVQILMETIKDKDFSKFCNTKMFNESLLSKLSHITSFFALNRIFSKDSAFISDLIIEITSQMNELENWIENFNLYRIEKLRSDLQIQKLDYQLDNVTAKLENFINSSKNKPAVTLYDNINKHFTSLEEKYRKYFLSSIIITLFLTVTYDPLLGIGGNLESLTCSINKNLIDCNGVVKSEIFPFNSDSLKYLLYKLSILIVGITLTTYFLRLSNFYQLKQEQAKQTKLELEAFPDYVSGMESSLANELRQELALKYFGKEIDQNQNDKTSDLLQEQLKVGTEFIKASAEIMKTVKPNVTSIATTESKKQPTE